MLSQSLAVHHHQHDYHYYYFPSQLSVTFNPFTSSCLPSKKKSRSPSEYKSHHNPQGNATLLTVAHPKNGRTALFEFQQTSCLANRKHSHSSYRTTEHLLKHTHTKDNKKIKDQVFYSHIAESVEFLS